LHHVLQEIVVGSGVPEQGTMTAYDYDLRILGAAVLSLASGAIFGVRYESTGGREQSAGC
jgi:hypothetical protein